MPNSHLIDFVNKLKDSGINVSFTKPRSQYVLKLVPTKQTPSITIKS